MVLDETQVSQFPVAAKISHYDAIYQQAFLDFGHCILVGYK